MRLWTVHPQYLDTKGILAAWREGLLAQKVLRNETKGYRNHPQLSRFKACSDPLSAMASYLHGIYAEAAKRGYRFDAQKIGAPEYYGTIPCGRGQLLYEWDHLRAKLRVRDAGRLKAFDDIEEPRPHPLFTIVEGGVEEWEILPALGYEIAEP